MDDKVVRICYTVIQITKAENCWPGFYALWAFIWTILVNRFLEHDLIEGDVKT